MIKGGAKVKGFLNYLKSPEFVAVGSAIILTPIISSFLLPLVRRIPAIGNHEIAVVIVASLIIFWIAKMIGGMYIKAILIGTAGGLLISSFLTTGFGQRFTSRLSATVGSATG